MWAGGGLWAVGLGPGPLSRGLAGGCWCLHGAGFSGSSCSARVKKAC